MILSPIENTGINIGGIWVQQRPRITQKFGLNKAIYSQFGMNGHSGIDIGVQVGTPVYAMFDGYVWRNNDGLNTGYGLHYKQRSAEKALEAVYGHLSSCVAPDGAYVNAGDLIGYSGNTGFSTGPHLHFGIRKLVRGTSGVKNWAVDNVNNGFKGYIDLLPYLITWKGGF